MIDTHSHIYLDEFDEDLEAMLERAEKEHVKRILLPAIDSDTHKRLLNLEKLAPGRCFAMMGLHPCSVKENFREELNLVHDQLEKRRFVAVGEIGLDFYWDKSFTEQQYEALHTQLEWAIHFDIPFSLHSREATEECIKVVADHQNGKLKGVFHCFSGNLQQAQKIIDLGFYLGIGGVVTFKNAGLDKVMESVDLKYVVLETDAPYLAPVPFRGKRNEPSYLKYVTEKLSLVKQQSVEEIGNITTENAERLFRLHDWM